MRRARRGAVKLEYAIIVMLISGLGISFFGKVGDGASGTFETVQAAFDESEEAAAGAGKSRSGHADGTNPGRGKGTDRAPDNGTDNPHADAAEGGGPFFP